MKKLLKFIGGRKVFLTIIIFVFSLVLLLLGGLVEDDFSQIIKTLLIIYPAGNVSQKLLVGKQDKRHLSPEVSGRKFIINLVIYFSIAVLTGFGILTSETYIGITTWLLSLYTLGNVTSKLNLGLKT